MSDELASFLIDVGFIVDTAEQAKLDAAVKATEDRLVAATTEGAKRRLDAEQASVQGRRKAVETMGGATVEAEGRRAAKVDAIRQKEGAKSRLEERARDKQTAALQGEQFKRLETGLLRISSVGQAVSSGLSGLLSAAPFGAFVLGVTQTASGLASLATQSQRVGASASHIQRFIFAMRQQGVDEGQANSDLEGFSRIIRSNEAGYRQALARMGVKTTDDRGNPLDHEQLLEQFGPVLARMPLNIAAIQAGHFGVTGPDTLNALRDPAGMQRGLGAYDEKLKDFGLDPDKAAADARKVDQAYSSLEADLKIINTKLQAEFFLPVMLAFDNLAKKMEQNPKAVENVGRGLEAATIALSARLLPKIANLGVRLSGLAPVLGQGLGAALGIVTNPVVALGASAESTPTAPVTTDPAERARKLADNTLPMSEWTAEEREAFSKEHGGGLWNWIKGKFGFGGDTTADTADSSRTTKALIDTADSTKKIADHLEKADAGLGGGGDGGGGLGGGGGGSGGGSGGGGSGGGASLGARGAHGSHGFSGGGMTPTKGALLANQKEAYAAAISEGLSPMAARALVANMSGEGLANDVHRTHQDLTHTATGIVQWEPSRVARIQSHFGKSLMDMSIAEQTKAAIWEIRTHYPQTKRALEGNDPRQMIGTLVDEFENPKDHVLTKTVRMGFYNGFNPSAAPTSPAPAPSAMAPAPAGTSGKAISDAEVFAARQRIAAGSRNPRDLDIVKQYLKDQNTPRAPGRPLGDSPGLRSSINNSRSNSFTRNGDTFNITGTDAKSGLDHAVQVSARREGQDRIRYGQGSVG